MLVNAKHRSEGRTPQSAKSNSLSGKTWVAHTAYGGTPRPHRAHERNKGLRLVGGGTTTRMYSRGSEFVIHEKLVPQWNRSFVYATFFPP